ncbi:MAG: D-alanyl-D-alanine carboxypeptidase [Clostridiales Family XIII bacterium]|nr:D-alanyl-D-alanine carboxypeptidase [Clostridiales Family XIII bacterium]
MNSNKVMKRILFATSVMIIFCLIVPTIPLSASQDDAFQVYASEADGTAGPDYSGQPNIIAPRAVLIEADTGKLLYEKDKDGRSFPASTAKIMTTLIAADTLDLTAKLIIDAEAAGVERGGFYFREGEEVSVDSLLYAMMLASANDAAVAVAKAVSGDVGTFAALMNERAEKIGAVNTHFVNPNGLHSEEGYTTPYDMALIAAEAMKNDNVRRYAQTIDYVVPPTNLQAERAIHNGNRLLVNDGGVVSIYGQLHPIYFPEATGLKTGRTPQAGNCLVATAEKDGLKLIAVVYGAVDEAGPFMDCIEMFEYGFHNYKVMEIIRAGDVVGKIEVKNGVAETVNAVIKSSVSAIVPMGLTKNDLEVKTEMKELIEAPVTAGSEVGRVFVYRNGAKLGESQLIAGGEVLKKDRLKVIKVTGTAIGIIVLSIVALVVIWILVAVIRTEIRKRNRWKKKYYRGDSTTKEVRRIKNLK